MKSSTVRRSALSRESMDIIENLSNESANNYDSQYSYNSEYSAPSEYYRESSNTTDNKSKEIDLLWQTFKSAQFNTKSPFMHVLGGFFLGVIVTSTVFSLFGMFVANSDNLALKNKFSIFTPAIQEQKTGENINGISEITNEQKIPADEIVSAAIVADDMSGSSKTLDEAANSPSIPLRTKKYIIKDGDTVEAIIKKNYGSYTPERAEAIMKANNLKDLDHISIDQELLLPIEN